MAGPFFNGIKGTTAGAPGAGAFTPNAASTGYHAWSTVPTGWWGLVRFEDTGTTWEFQYCYWNGTTLSRSATNQFVSSSSGTALTLTAAATATMIADGFEIAPHPATPQRAWRAQTGVATVSTDGLPTCVQTGTAAAAVLATTNFLTEQARVQLTSLTTANAQCGWSAATTAAAHNTTAGRGGFEFAARFAIVSFPATRRVFVGVTSTTMLANAGEPSALVANVAALAMDSTDTNLQFLTNSNAGAGTKIDTGIALVANGVYEVSIWADPGSTTFKILLVRLDTGAIFYRTTATDTPVTSVLFAQMLCGLSATTGVAFVLQPCELHIRNGN